MIFIDILFPVIHFIICSSKTETEGGVPEWKIIELQGLIQMKKDNQNGPTVVGDLHYFSRNRHPVLVLGHHVLNGKEVALEQPMAVIEKATEGDKHAYKVKAIVKKKLLFKSRPKPIISNVSDKVWTEIKALCWKFNCCYLFLSKLPTI